MSGEDGSPADEERQPTPIGGPSDAGVEPLLRVEGLTKRYTTTDGFLDRLLGGGETITAVDDVDLDIYAGETVGLVGESGCGKTSLGRSLPQLVEPTSGSVRYRGTELTDCSDRELRERRTDIQYVFQNPTASLNPKLTVGDIVGEALTVHDIVPPDRRDDRVNELLETVGLRPGHASRYPHEFSGGQRQRIGIARALAVEPEVIVCDEPVSALDVSAQARILNLLADLQAAVGLSYLVISHDLSVVDHLADRIAVMYLGEIVERGPTEAVFGDPSHPYTEALRSAIPEPDPRWEGDRIVLEGAVPEPADPPAGCPFHTRCHRIIPPDRYAFADGVFRRLLALRTDLAGAETIDGLRAASEADDVPTAIRAAYDLPGELADPAAERVLSSALGQLERGRPDAARKQVDDAFRSPCERHSPTLQAGPDHHPIACLRFDRAETDSHRPDRTDTDGHQLDRTDTDGHQLDRTDTDSHRPDRTDTDSHRPDRTDTDSQPHQ